jgi:hypothetical protein
MGRAADDGGTHEHWLVARRDPETGIESLRAHFSATHTTRTITTTC